MTKWKAFAALAVEHLGMPVGTMLLYPSDAKRGQEFRYFKNKEERKLEFVLESRNFGHNRDSSYFAKYSLTFRIIISFGRRIGDILRNAIIFSLDSLRFIV